MQIYKYKSLKKPDHRVSQENSRETYGLEKCKIIWHYSCITSTLRENIKIYGFCRWHGKLLFVGTKGATLKNCIFKEKNSLKVSFIKTFKTHYCSYCAKKLRLRPFVFRCLLKKFTSFKCNKWIEFCYSHFNVSSPQRQAMTARLDFL